MELYAFLQHDLSALMRSAAAETGLANPYRPDCSVVRNLAQLVQQTDQWSAGRAAVIDHKLTRGTPRIDICGLATFVPDATSADPNRRNRARAAIKVISSLAAELKQLGHTVAFIEIVAGSRVARLSRKRLLAGAANLLVELDTLPRTQAYLADFLQGISAASGFRGVYSIELEPGASFAFNSVQVLENAVHFCRSMESRGVTVGYNLDIAHWTLARAVPGRIPAEVIDLIAHCHVCDSYRGHMDDSPLCSIRAAEEFAEWLGLVQSKVNSAAATVPFSGYVSLELECAKELDDVRDSIDQLGQLIG